MINRNHTVGGFTEALNAQKTHVIIPGGPLTKHQLGMRIEFWCGIFTGLQQQCQIALAIATKRSLINNLVKEARPGPSIRRWLT
jgi:hypothetical protein